MQPLPILIHSIFCGDNMEDDPMASVMLRGKALAETGAYPEAIECFEEVVSTIPENHTAWYYLGVLQANIGSTHQAIQAFETVDRHFPNHAPTLSNLAVLLQNDNPLKASEYAKVALLKFVDNEELLRISDVSIVEEREETPEKMFIEAQPVEYSDDLQNISDHESDIESKMVDADNLTTIGNHASAVSIWKGLLEGSPRSPEVWRGLGEALMAAGYPDRAEQCRKRANNLADSAKEFELPQTNQNDDVEQALIRAAEENDATKIDSSDSGDNLNDSITWYNMGLNLLNEGNSEEALTCFEKAIGGCPKDELALRVRAQNGRGNALFNAERYSESVIAYHTAITMDPSSVSGRTLFNMGSSYAAVELYEDAIKCFTQAMQRGLDKEEAELCEKQISRCRLLFREQTKRQSKAMR